MTMNKTYSPKPGDIERAWLVVDATDLPLGRLASEIATLLRGKHKPTYAPHVDGGDFVVVVNADKVAVTSDKSQTKIYYRHSGYPGGIKAETFESLLERRPEAVIERAVRGMLPKNKLGRQMALGGAEPEAPAVRPHSDVALPQVAEELLRRHALAAPADGRDGITAWRAPRAHRLGSLDQAAIDDPITVGGGP